MDHVAAEVAEISLRTLQVSGTATVLSCVAGVPLGVVLGRSRRRLARIGVLLAHVCLGMPPVVVGLALYLLFSRSGPLGPMQWLFTKKVMILAQVVLSTPFVVAVVATAVAAVPIQLEEHLKAIGATPRQARFFALREARHGVALAVAAAFGRSVSEVGAVLIVGGNIAHHTRVLTTAIVLETSRGRFELALALGLVLLSLAFVANTIVLLVQFRSTGPALPTVHEPP